MYEEEDDDLPLQYRRLTAHLQTGSADFNRRLAAYLTNHVAMRSALDQAITNSYAQQYPNAPQFAHNEQNMFPSPLATQGFMPPSQPQQQQGSMQSPHPYRQSPYPVPGTPGYRQQSHHRSSSIASPTAQSHGAARSPTDPTGSHGNRRMSVPASLAVSPNTARPPLAPQPSPSDLHPKVASPGGALTASPSQSMPPPLMQQYNSSAYQDFGPLSTSLPLESQQMLMGATFDQNDPLASMFMAGGQNLGQSFFDFGSVPSFSKQSNFHPSYDGMNATLAPSALDMSPPHLKQNDPAPRATPPATTSPFHLDLSQGLGDFKGVHYNTSNSLTGSGTVTPGDGGWDAFIDDNSWAENAT